MLVRVEPVAGWMVSLSTEASVGVASGGLRLYCALGVCAGLGIRQRFCVGAPLAARRGTVSRESTQFTMRVPLAEMSRGRTAMLLMKY